MTISRTIRKRLRRYALFCLMAATTASVVDTSQRSFAGETHDSSDLCGWIEELSDATVDQPDAIGSEKATPIAAPQFLAVEFNKTLSIDTCSYDAWLAQAIKTESFNTLVETPDEDLAEVASEVPEATPEADASPASVALDGEANTPPATPSRTSSQFNATIATIAAAASAGNPIPFGQWTEPFAMIGPDASHTTKQIAAFQAWFDQGKRLATEFVPVVDFDGEIASPAIQAIAEKELAKPNAVTQQKQVDVEAADENPLVGSSPFIVTIDEAYLPYDLADSDLDVTPETDVVDVVDVVDSQPTADDPIATPQVVWADGLFSSQRHPFCIRSLVEMREPGWSPLAKSATDVPRRGSEMVLAPTTPLVAEAESDEVAAASDVSAPEADALIASESDISGSADCLLDEVIWQVSVALEDERVTDRWLRPDWIGTKLASLVVSGDRLASRVASELALVWPVDAKPAKPIPGSGAKLLARAEAAEQLPAEGMANPFTPEQLAQADAMFRQWVDVAQGVIGDLSDRFKDVTEVARTRGTQDDSKRR